MKNLLILVLIILFSTNAVSQNKKISIELNYPLVSSIGLLDFNGIIDGNIKYRFLDTEAASFGGAYTIDYIKSSLMFGHDDLKGSYLFHNLDIFAELNIESVNKIHPYSSIGYSYIAHNQDYKYSDDYGSAILNKSYRNNGFNFKFGLYYDLTSSLYIQSNYHFVRAFVEDGLIRSVNYNFFKFGLGTKF